jgi:uncharacterized glyoxalase superfamily protein PhnB
MPATLSSFQLQSLAPVLIVDAVEPSTDFWVDRLGFSRENAVPGPEGKLIFASVKKDGVEIMYQTWESVEKDVGHVPQRAVGTSVGLFIEVSNLDEIVKQIEGVPLVLPRRKTFYGMDEVGVAEAGGHTVVFAQPVA